MGDSIKYTGDADYSRVIRENKKLIAANDKVIRQLKEQIKGSKKAESSDTHRLSSAAAGVGKMALQFAGVGSALGGIYLAARQLRAEYDNLVERQRAAAESQMTTSQLRARALDQAPLSEIPAHKIDAMVDRISQATKQTPADIWRTANSPFSAKGARSFEDLEAAMTAAGKVGVKMGPDFNTGALSSTILDIITATGLRGPDAGDQALGWIRKFGAAARIEGVEAQGQALAPSVTAGVQFGVPPEAVAEMVASTAHIINDRKGNVSRTAITNFLSKVSTEALLPGTGRGGGKSFVPGETFEEKRDYLRDTFWPEASAEQRAALMTSLGGKAQAKIAYRAILAPTASAREQIAAAEGAIPGPTDPGLQAFNANYLAALRGQQMQKTADAAQVTAQSNQAWMNANPEGTTGGMRQNMIDWARTHGASAMAQKVARLQFEAATLTGADPIEAASKALKVAFQDKVSPTTVGTGPYDIFESANPNYSRELVDALREYTAELRAIKDATYGAPGSDDTLQAIERNTSPSATERATPEEIQ
jgi:hypothetical protein